MLCLLGLSALLFCLLCHPLLYDQHGICKRMYTQLTSQATVKPAMYFKFYAKPPSASPVNANEMPFSISLLDASQLTLRCVSSVIFCWDSPWISSCNLSSILRALLWLLHLSESRHCFTAPIAARLHWLLMEGEVLFVSCLRKTALDALRTLLFFTKIQFYQVIYRIAIFTLYMIKHWTTYWLRTTD